MLSGSYGVDNDNYDDDDDSNKCSRLVEPFIALN